MKALTLALCILALLGSAASGYFWWQIGESKKQLQTELSQSRTRAGGLETELAKTQQDREAVRADLSARDAELGDVKVKLTAAEARNIQNTRELSNLKAAVATKEENERKLNEDLSSLRQELVQSRLAGTAGGNPEEVEKYKQSIAALEAKISQLQANALSAAASSSALARTPAVGGSADSAAGSESGNGTAATIPLGARTASARVAQVGTRNAFVVLELGAGSGVVAGQKFTIIRNDKAIAESIVSEVKDTYAIAHVIPSSLRSVLRSGDVAAILATSGSSAPAETAPATETPAAEPTAVL